MFTGVGFVFATRSDSKAISFGRSYEARLALEEPSLDRLTYLQMWRFRAGGAVAAIFPAVDEAAPARLSGAVAGSVATG